jgi:hypothetical protein
MPRGGARPGAGRKKETPVTQQVRLQRSIEKEVLRERARAIIAPRLRKLLKAQIAHAEGLKYLVTRDKKTGKFIRVGPAMAANVEEETVEVWEKDPSVQAFTELMNRLLDKSKEQEQEIKVRGDDDLLARLGAARKRAKTS